MAPHSSPLAWKIPWMEEPGRLQSMGSLRVGHDWVTSLSLSLSCIGEGNGNPVQCFCLENPRDGAAWWAAIYGVAQSQTRLKRLSSSSKWISNVFSYLILIFSSWVNTLLLRKFSYNWGLKYQLVPWPNPLRMSLFLSAVPWQRQKLEECLVPRWDSFSASGTLVWR